jgi:hypothetical protein
MVTVSRPGGRPPPGPVHPGHARGQLNLQVTALRGRSPWPPPGTASGPAQAPAPAPRPGSPPGAVSSGRAHGGPGHLGARPGAMRRRVPAAAARALPAGSGHGAPPSAGSPGWGFPAGLQRQPGRVVSGDLLGKWGHQDAPCRVVECRVPFRAGQDIPAHLRCELLLDLAHVRQYPRHDDAAEPLEKTRVGLAFPVPGSCPDGHLLPIHFSFSDPPVGHVFMMRYSHRDGCAGDRGRGHAALARAPRRQLMNGSTARTAERYAACSELRDQGSAPRDAAEQAGLSAATGALPALLPEGTPRAAAAEEPVSGTGVGL